MARFSTKITSKTRDELSAAITKEITNRWSKRRQDIRKAVVVETEDTIEANKDRFQPHRSTLGGPEIVGILGVGDGGTPDYEKMRNAYKLLIPTRSSTISRISLSFQKRASRFGRVELKFDLAKFYDAEITNYTSFSGGTRVRVPWMQNFIMGVAAPGYAFVDSSDPEFNTKNSRTGLGHMVSLDKIGRFQIPRKQFVFEGVGESQTTELLLRRIKKRLEKRAFGQKIERLLGG